MICSRQAIYSVRNHGMSLFLSLISLTVPKSVGIPLQLGTHPSAISVDLTLHFHDKSLQSNSHRNRYHSICQTVNPVYIPKLTSTIYIKIYS